MKTYQLRVLWLFDSWEENFLGPQPSILDPPRKIAFPSSGFAFLLLSSGFNLGKERTDYGL